MTIPLAPTVPNPNTSTFGAETYPFTVWLASLGPAIDAATAQINSNLVLSALGVTSTSSTSVPIATGALAIAVEQNKGFAPGMTLKVASTASPSNYMVGTVTSYNSATGALVMNVSSIAGAGTFANWTISVSVQPNTTPTLLLSQRTANAMLAAGDAGKLIDITANTFTQTFDAAAALGNGWYAYVRNSGTGDITLDPNGSELIDGMTSFVMYPGECRLIQCNGTALTSVVLQSFYKQFTASATFTKPPGYKAFAGELFGAGGSGCKSGSANNGGGGGGGACNPFNVPESFFAATETITIGAGGAAQTAANAAGQSGGTSSIGSKVFAYGGYGGSSAGGGGGGGIEGTGGIATGGAPKTINDNTAQPTQYWDVFGGSGAGQPGSIYGGGCGAFDNGGAGTLTARSSIYGGGGGGSNTQTTGGTSRYGGSGGNGSSAGNGQAGTAPGGGGGSTFTGSTSGAGARGELRIRGVM